MTSISTYTPSSQQKKPKKAGKNKGWISLYVALILLWIIVLTATIRSWLFGTEAVVDSLDISYFTLPALVFNLVFVSTTFVIYLVYFGSYRRAVKHQRKIISIIAGEDREENLHDDHLISALG